MASPIACELQKCLNWATYKTAVRSGQHVFVLCICRPHATCGDQVWRELLPEEVRQAGGF